MFLNLANVPHDLGSRDTTFFPCLKCQMLARLTRGKLTKPWERGWRAPCWCTTLVHQRQRGGDVLSFTDKSQTHFGNFSLYFAYCSAHLYL